MAVGDADRISMSSCSSFAGIASKILGECEMMGRYQCLVQLFSEILFFYGVTGGRDLQGRTATPDDTLECRHNNVLNKTSDIIHHF